METQKREKKKANHVSLLSDPFSLGQNHIFFWRKEDEKSAARQNIETNKNKWLRMRNDQTPFVIIIIRLNSWNNKETGKRAFHPKLIVMLQNSTILSSSVETKNDDDKEKPFFFCQDKTIFCVWVWALFLHSVGRTVSPFSQDMSAKFEKCVNVASKYTRKRCVHHQKWENDCIYVFTFPRKRLPFPWLTALDSHPIRWSLSLLFGFL